MSRQLRSILPITKTQLKPKVIPEDITRQNMKITQNRQKTCFDVGSRKLSSLSPGQELDSDTEDSGNQNMSRTKSIPDHTMLKIRMEINFEESKRHPTVKRNPF